MTRTPFRFLPIDEYEEDDEPRTIDELCCEEEEVCDEDESGVPRWTARQRSYGDGYDMGGTYETIDDEGRRYRYYDDGTIRETRTSDYGWEI
jgi:hypothetical protein